MSSLGRSTTETVVSIACSAALDCVGDDLLRAVSGHLARFGLETLDEVCGVAPRVRFDLLEKQVARFVRRQARNALQLALAIGEQLFAARRRRLGAFLQIDERGFSLAQVALELVGGRDAIRKRAGPVGERGFEANDLLLAFARVLLGFSNQPVGLLTGLELGFFLEGFGLAFGLGPELAGVFLGASHDFGGDPLAAGNPIRHGGDRYERRQGRQDEVHG
jgi:hypothetical protein